MNLTVFKRNISLQKLGIGSLDGNEKRLYDVLVDNISSLNYYIDDECPDIHFLGESEEEIIFTYNSKKKFLVASYDGIWKFFLEEFDMNYHSTESLILWYIDNAIRFNEINTVNIISYKKLYPY